MHLQVRVFCNKMSSTHDAQVQTFRVAIYAMRPSSKGHSQAPSLGRRLNRLSAKTEFRRLLSPPVRRCATRIYKRDWSGSFFVAAVLIPDTLINKIAARPEFNDEHDLKSFIADEWLWWETYGRELHRCLLQTCDAQQTTQAQPPLPSAARAAPRKRNAVAHRQSPAAAVASELPGSSSSVAMRQPPPSSVVNASAEDSFVEPPRKKQRVELGLPGGECSRTVLCSC